MELFGPLRVYESDQCDDKRKLEKAISTRNSRAEDLSLMQDLILKVPDKIKELPASPMHSKVFENHSRYPKSCNKTLTKSSKRKNARSNLKLVKIFHKKAGKEACKFSVRLWKDKDGMPFYDCSCDGRMPGSLSSITTIVLDVLKIEKHLEVHDKGDFVCNICGKVFKNNFFQLNAHKKIHKKDRIL
jgi:hypothetical protein